MNDGDLGTGGGESRHELLDRLVLLDGQVADVPAGGRVPPGRAQTRLDLTGAGGGEQGGGPPPPPYLGQERSGAGQERRLDGDRGGQAPARLAIGPADDDRRRRHPSSRPGRDQASEDTANASPTAAIGAGGLSTTVTLPPAACTRARPRAHPGSASRAARLASLPAVPASAPASAAPSAIDSEYPTSSS